MAKIARKGSKLVARTLSDAEIRKNAAKKATLAQKLRISGSKELTERLEKLLNLSSTAHHACHGLYLDRFDTQKAYDERERAALGALADLFHEVRAQHPAIADYLTKLITPEYVPYEHAKTANGLEGKDFLARTGNVHPAQVGFAARPSRARRPQA